MRLRRRASHGQIDGAQARRSTRFVQLIEFQTSRIDDVRALERQWREATAASGSRAAMSIAKDRDRQNRYVWMVEFPSREHAARSGDMEETAVVAEQLMKLADGPAVVRNLDVLEPLG